MEVPPHLLGPVVSRSFVARLQVDRAQRQRTSTQLSLPIGRLVVSEDGRAHLPVAKRVLRTQATRTPFGDIRLVGLTIGLLPGDQNSLVSGPKPRSHLVVQRLNRRQTVRVMPDPRVADIETSGFQALGKHMRQVRKTEHRDMRTGLQYPMDFGPKSNRSHPVVPRTVGHRTLIGWVDHPPIDAVAWQFGQSEKGITRQQVNLGHLNLRR